MPLTNIKKSKKAYSGGSKKAGYFIAAICIAGAAVVAGCNIWVVTETAGKCFGGGEELAAAVEEGHAFGIKQEGRGGIRIGIVFGTGRSAAASPYYDTRVAAAAELMENGLCDVLIVSGEHLYADYNEVDSMAADVRRRVPDAKLLLDYEGTDTYASLVTARRYMRDDAVMQAIGYDAGLPYTLVCISQHFQNQRAIFYGKSLWNEDIYGYDANDTDKWLWRIRNTMREWLARVKAAGVVGYYYVAGE